MKAIQVLCRACSGLMWMLGMAACASMNGTPMRGSADCRYVPSVEDCQAVGERIEDLCLRTCVLHQCRRGRAVCGEVAQIKCVQRSGEKKAGGLGGFVYDVDQTCEMPREEVNWCELPRSPPCQAQMMVHELAHACGWHHFDGNGVPGNDGNLKCL